MLTDHQQRLWESYLRAESRAPRAQKLTALDAVLDALVTSAESDWQSWARSLAERVVDGGEDSIIRMPLFERAVFPALVSGLRAGLPGCARWLAGLSEHLSRCPRCQAQLPPDQRAELGLLRAAVHQAPADRSSRRRLIDLLAERLRFALHELPAGVLYGMDGATPGQCLELGQEVEAFARLTTDDGSGPTYESLVRLCRFHFSAYRDFLLHRGEYGSYPEYLARRGADITPGGGEVQ